MKKMAVLSIIVLLVATGLAQAANRLVPGEYATIQAGIDAAVDGDVVIIAAGTYTGDGNRDIDFKGKKITVRSTDPNDPNIVAATIIDCQGSSSSQHRGFYFHSGEDANSSLSGLTITNGYNRDGGGIYCLNSSPTITNCNISGNQAYRIGGGGIAWISSGPFDKLMITNCIISNNSTNYDGRRGGGIYANNNSSNFYSCLTLINCIISNNTCDYGGGGIWADKTNLALVRCNIIANKVISDDYNSNGGGGIGGSGSSVFSHEGGLIITQCTINDNYVGGLYDGGNGGGILWDGALKISDSTINGNTAAYGGGGGIHIENLHGYVDTDITRCTINGNHSWGSGGGIYCQVYSLKISDSTISGNKVCTNNIIMATTGGGISFGYSGFGMRCGALDVARCSINDNFAMLSGGIYWYGPMKIADSTIIGNNAFYSQGGGISGSGYEGGTAEIVNCIIAGNINLRSTDSIPSPTYGGGGIKLSRYLESRIVNCSIIKNKTAGYGGGILCSLNPGNQFVVKNCILWANEASSGPEIYLLSGSLDLLSVNFSDLQGGKDSIGKRDDYVSGTVNYGPGNIDADPCLVDFGYWSDPNNTPADANDDVWVNSDYHLLEASPCINTGDPNYVPEPNETDLDGLPRIIDGRIDMGPYEFNHIPIADAGPDQTIEAKVPWGAKVHLDGSNSSDEDSTPGTNDDIVSFNWFEQIDPCDPNANVLLGSGQTLDCNLPLGRHTIILEVTGEFGASDSNEVTVIVQDTTPPLFNLSVTPTILWPANKAMVKITPTWTVSDLCDLDPTVSLVDIQVSEPGAAPADIRIDGGSIYLRACRSGNAGSRVYTITYRAVDDFGNTAESSAIVTVPHDQRPSK